MPFVGSGVVSASGWMLGSGVAVEPSGSRAGTVPVCSVFASEDTLSYVRIGDTGSVRRGVTRSRGESRMTTLPVAVSGVYGVDEEHVVEAPTVKKRRPQLGSGRPVFTALQKKKWGVQKRGGFNPFARPFRSSLPRCARADSVPGLRGLNSRDSSTLLRKRLGCWLDTPRYRACVLLHEVSTPAFIAPEVSWSCLCFAGGCLWMM